MKKNNQKIILNVPLRHQPNNSLECSLTVLKMVMDYWNDNIPYSTLVTELSEWINEEERHIQGVGIFLAKRGYEVLFIHHDSNVVDKATENITEGEKAKLIKALEAIPKDDSTVFQRRKLSLDIAYIGSGGKYSNAIPTLGFIDSNLKKNIPVIVCVKLQIWRSTPKKRGNHYVVIVGKEKNKYIVNDPDPKTFSPYKVGESKLLMSWYACGAYALAAYPKKDPVTITNDM